jgi:pimeloyl-ACP methyl ester carboxylesterase
MELADGRHLGWTEFGEREGTCVVLFHGTPGTRRQLVVDDPAAPAPWRCLSVDRPGYGWSSFHPTRTFTSWAHDVEALVDHLGVERFCVLGFSGGGPNALACAAVLGDRVVGTALVASVAPKPAGSREPGRVLAARRRLGAELQIRLQRRAPAQALDALVRSLPPRDAAVLRRPEVRRRFEEDLEAPSATAARTIAQDRALSSRDWGVDVARISGSVDIWHGTEDRSVPFAAAATLHALLPGSVVHVEPGSGHFFVFDRFAEIIATLVAPRGAVDAT